VTGIRIEIDENVTSLSAEVRRRLLAGFVNALDTAERTARESAPRRTGRLSHGIHAFLDGGGGGRLAGALVSRAPYSSYLHFGTGVYGPRKRPYTVVPKRKKALFWPGARHPVKGATIRGMKPGDFLREAVRESLIRRAFDEGFETGAGRNEEGLAWRK
jgi:hypothetical protein